MVNESLTGFSLMEALVFRTHFTTAGFHLFLTDGLLFIYLVSDDFLLSRWSRCWNMLEIFERGRNGSDMEDACGSSAFLMDGMDRHFTSSISLVCGHSLSSTAVDELLVALSG